MSDRRGCGKRLQCKIADERKFKRDRRGQRKKRERFRLKIKVEIRKRASCDRLVGV